MDLKLRMICARFPLFTLSGLIVGLIPGLIPLSAVAQSLPEIEQIQQQNERILQQLQQRQDFDQKQLEHQRERVVLPLPPASSKQPSPVSSPSCFAIDQLTVLGVTVYEPGVIDSIVRPYQHQCLGLDSINDLLKSLSGLYLDDGYSTTRAYLPQQSLASGTLIIQVVEGHIEDFDTLQALGVSVATAYPGLLGKPLNLRDIEQGIEQVNRLSANRLRMELLPGRAIGGSVVKLINQRQSSWQGNIRLDNSGQDATGEEQGRLYLGRDNLFGLNDFLYLSYQADFEGSSQGKRSESLALRFEVPYGYWLFSLDASDYQYLNRVAGLNQLFDTNGETSKQVLTASRVVHRDQSGKTEILGSLSRKQGANYVEGVRLDTSSRTLGVASIQFRHREFFAGNQSLESALSYRKGLGLLGGSDRPDGDSADPRYHAWLVDVGYSRQFTWLDRNWSLRSQWSMQHSDNRLFGSEQFSIGSQYSVRGFKQDSLAARSGAYWRNDLSLGMAVAATRFGIDRLSVGVGLDLGTITNDPDNPDNDEVLQGVALVLGVAGKYLSSSLTVARANDRPGSFTGDKDVIYFSLTLDFQGLGL
jgi:hemolysin activation/secretion protein